MFKLNLLTPEKKVVFGQEVEEVTLPAHRGELDILPGHSPLMTTLGSGTLKFKLKGGESRKMAIAWGYCQVSAEGVNVLAEFVTAPEEARADEAHRILNQIDSRLLNDFLTDDEYEKLQKEKARYTAEINLSGLQ